MISGKVTSEREAIVPLQIEAPDGALVSVEAVIDTGFTESIALPPEQVAELGLPLRGAEWVTLGDGRETALWVHDAIVHWHGRRVCVPAFETEGGTLIGMALLQGSRLMLDVTPDGAVRIEPLGSA